MIQKWLLPFDPFADALLQDHNESTRERTEEEKKRDEEDLRKLDEQLRPFFESDRDNEKG